jgi:hypothetical protein
MHHRPAPLRFGTAGFWPVQYHPTEPIVRKGLIKAIELAIETNRPLDSYWIPASDRFETIVILNDQQVTRLILTPPTPPPQRPERIANSAAIWMIKRGVVEPFEDAEDTSGPVLITRLKIPPAPAVWPNA